MTPAQRLAGLLAGAAPAEGVMGRRGGETVDWPRFLHQARCWQAAFAAHPGHRYALCLADALGFAAALFGAWQAGKQVWLPGDLAPATRAALQSAVDGWAGDVPAGEGIPTLAADAQAAAPASAPLDVEAEALVVFTSGSSGRPEACHKRLRQLFDEVTALQAAFGDIGPGATVVASVSPQHVYGLLFRVLWPLATGRCLQAQTLTYLEDLTDLLPLNATGLLVTSPTHLARLPVKAPEAASRVAGVFSSGAPLPESALPDAIRVFNQAPVEVFGSTETGGIAWRQRNPGAPRTWQALPAVQWRLEGQQLAIQSPHLASADWTVCADRVVAVEGGFEIQGRADRIVKLAEKRISLRAVEEALLHSGLLSGVGLVMLEDERTHIGVVAVPTAAGWALHDAQGRRALAEALRQGLLQVVERVALPRRWRFLPELPTNAQGKATQARLAAEFDPRRPRLRALSRDGARAELTLLVDPALPQFDGHFPGHPVLPGVAQLEWALRFGRELFDLPGAFTGIDALKFQRIIRPGQRLVLDLHRHSALRLDFRYHSEAGPHATGRLLFAEGAA